MEPSSRKDELRKRMERLQQDVADSVRECHEYEDPADPSPAEQRETSMSFSSSSIRRGGSGGDSMQEDYESILSSVLDDRRAPKEKSGRGGPPIVSRGGWLDEDSMRSSRQRNGAVGSGYRFKVDDSENETVALSIMSMGDDEDYEEEEEEEAAKKTERKEKGPYEGMDDLLFPPSRTEREITNDKSSGESSPKGPKQRSEEESRIERKRLDEEVAILRERRNRSLGKLSSTLLKERASDIHSVDDLRTSMLSTSIGLDESWKSSQSQAASMLYRDPTEDGSKHDKMMTGKKKKGGSDEEFILEDHEDRFRSSDGVKKVDSERFWKRMLAFQEKKKTSQEELKKRVEEESSKELTFQPKVQPSSSAILASSLRLSTADSKGAPGKSIHLRLYADSAAKEKKEKLERELRAEEEAKLRETCTFKPSLTSSSRKKMQTSKPRYLEDAEEYAKKHARTARTPSRKSTGEREFEYIKRQPGFEEKRVPERGEGTGSVAGDHDECTFAPKVNKKPESIALESYLKESAFDRLSRSKGSKDMTGEEFDGDRQQYQTTATSSSTSPARVSLSRGERHGRGFRTPGPESSSRRRGRPSSAPPRRPSYGSARRDQSSLMGRSMAWEPDVEVDRGANTIDPEDDPKFQAFLARQQQALKEKEEKRVALLESMEQVRKPKICSKSKRILMQSGDADFFRRQRRTLDAKEKKSRASLDPSHIDENCTFRPRINAISQFMRGRTAEELSRGDFERKKARLEGLRLEGEQREMEEVTFAPTSKMVQPPRFASKSATQGRLRLSSESHTYLQRLKDEARRKKERIQEMVGKKEKREMEECTFRPVVHDAPAYVKRIARSMALARGSRTERDFPEEHQQPAWV
eukprot:TRINITY_DN1161_c0_g1_i2.p1 TRINITY_DN1161_c0_g1~~TRINITY_DN1161_c0_g1_i2.p1  ORF type:complete len:867 (-),score=315.19 TRINITY_DN1161_c0_g1_i2:247-2847(-)